MSVCVISAVASTPWHVWGRHSRRKEGQGKSKVAWDSGGIGKGTNEDQWDGGPKSSVQGDLLIFLILLAA